MRKQAFLYVCISLFVCVGSAFAGSCGLVNCSHGRGWSSGYANREMLTPDGRTGGALDGDDYTGRCFVCNNSSAGNETCDKNDKVAIISSNQIAKVYRCDVGAMYDSWEDYNFESYAGVCGDSPLKRVISGAVVTYRNGDSQSGTSGIAPSTLLTNSQRINSLCKYIECGPDKIAGADRESCVDLNTNCPLSNGTYALTGDVIDGGPCAPGNPSTGLSDTAHVKSGNMCKLTCVAGGWNVELKDGACESGWVVDTSSRKKCVEDPGVVAEREKSQKEKCEGSGGVWASGNCTCDAAKNLKKSGDVCVCLNDTEYKRSADGKSCVLTDAAAAQKACEAAAASGAVWQDGRCKCSDREKKWDGAQKKCVENTDIALCKSAKGTKWDYKLGECVCTDGDYEYDYDNNECVEKEDVRKKREAEQEAARKRAEQEEIKGRITAIGNELQKQQAGLGKSVWKNREGNFNTSRLVSDSVAGVVLGTAGGLITSNIIKKNQVKGGFEDLNCTVRGQVVAGYGDEFQVGIQ